MKQLFRQLHTYLPAAAALALLVLLWQLLAGSPLVPGYLPAYDFGCVGGAYARRCVGGEINVHPDLPHAERMARHEGCWLYHSVLLGEKADMDDIADGMLKVYENLDELL
ncbi:MAG: hypothetical protein IJF62_03710 [Firmicutes bacterium]|nr:hypothetical protein [Bacillota bacterium]